MTLICPWVLPDYEICENGPIMLKSWEAHEHYGK